MMMQRLSWSFSASALRRWQYSTAVSGSWMEQGPTMTSRRSSCCVMILAASLRPRRTVSSACLGIGSSWARSWGGINGSYPRTRSCQSALIQWVCLMILPRTSSLTLLDSSKEGMSCSLVLEKECSRSAWENAMMNVGVGQIYINCNM